MSFVLNLANADGVLESWFVPFTSNVDSLDNGVSVSSSNTLPSNNMSKDDCERCGMELGSISNPFEVGIGVDLTVGGTADTFFKKCYPDIYKEGCAKRLAESRALLAEVSIPVQNITLLANVKVVAEAGACPQGVIHTIYFPLPLMMLNEFS